MIRRIVGNAMGRAAMTAAGLMLATVGVATLPAVSAGAATANVVSYWGTNHYEDNDSTYQCGTTWETNQGRNQVDEVYNPCNARVWVHYYNDGTGESQGYCINPGGGLAYDIPMQWNNSATFSDIQLTGNTSQCDAGTNAQTGWASGTSEKPESYACHVGDTHTLANYHLTTVLNYCDARIWLHGSDGSTLCVSPTGSSGEIYGGPYPELQMSAVQAPCTAGGYPYPY